MTDIRQKHFRFRTDAGAADGTPTWGASEDVDYYPGTANFRLRVGLQNAGANVAATAWEIYVSKNGDTFTPVTTTIAKGVQSVDAGSSADDTAILIPRLTPFGSGWWLANSSVDLWFENDEYYDSNSGQLANNSSLLSCTRASTGYAKTSAGTLTSFASNQLRRTDLGLLVEDARTNICQASEDITNAAVFNTISLVTLTANQAAAPNGANTADLLVPNTSSGFHYVGGSQGTSGSAVKWTWSTYFKNAGYNFAIFSAKNVSATLEYQICVNLTTGNIDNSRTVSGSPTGVSSSVETLANGWFRASITMDFAAATGIDLTIGAQPTSAFSSFVGDGTSGVYVWGVQIEEGAFPSSYIPTTGTSATRAADAVTISGAAQTTIAAAIGSIVAQTGNAVGTSFAANIVDSNGTNVLGFDATNHALASLVATLATSNTANRSTSDDKLGLAWSGAGRSLVLNGATVVTDASAQTPSSTQRLGSANGTSNFIYAYLRRLTLWNTKLADATLDLLTS